MPAVRWPKKTQTALKHQDDPFVYVLREILLKTPKCYMIGSYFAVPSVGNHAALIRTVLTT